MLLVTHAMLIPVDPAGPDHIDVGWMLVGDDGRILALGAAPAPAGDLGTRVLDAGGAFVAPGFVSAHSHLFTSGARGLGVDETL